MRLRATTALLIICVLSQMSSVASADVSVYRLKKGEGLSDVSRKYHVPLGTLIRLNRSRLPRKSDPNYVYAGMRVLVPAPAKKAAKPAASPAHEPVPAVVKPAAQTRPQPPKATATAVKPAKPPTTPAAGQPVGPAAKQPPVTQAEKPGAAKQSSKTPEDLIFPKDKTLGTISPEARRAVKPAQAPAAPPEAKIPTLWTSLTGVVYALAAFLVVAILALLWMLRLYLSNGHIADSSGPLVLVATRSLGRKNKLFWFKADGKDLFVSTGVESKILATEKPADVPTAPVIAAAVQQAAKAPASRRPRKNGPSASTPPPSAE